MPLPIIPLIFDFLRTVWSLLKDRETRGVVYLVILVLISGMLFYHSVEGWSWLELALFQRDHPDDGWLRRFNTQDRRRQDVHDDLHLHWPRHTGRLHHLAVAAAAGARAAASRAAQKPEHQRTRNSFAGCGANYRK